MPGTLFESTCSGHLFLIMCSFSPRSEGESFGREEVMSIVDKSAISSGRAIQTSKDDFVSHGAATEGRSVEVPQLRKNPRVGKYRFESHAFS